LVSTANDQSPYWAQLKEIAAPGLVLNGSRGEGTLIGTVEASQMPPGRGTMVNRKIGKLMNSNGLSTGLVGLRIAHARHALSPDG
jgi:hypothetical protein